MKLVKTVKAIILSQWPYFCDVEWSNGKITVFLGEDRVRITQADSRNMEKTLATVFYKKGQGFYRCDATIPAAALDYIRRSIFMKIIELKNRDEVLELLPLSISFDPPSMHEVAEACCVLVGCLDLDGVLPIHGNSCYP